MTPDDWKSKAVPSVVHRRVLRGEFVHTEGFDASDYERPTPAEQPTYLFNLPLPPSANSLVRPAILGGRTGKPVARLVKTRISKGWLTAAVKSIQDCFPLRRKLHGPVYVSLTLYVARVSADIDNRVKALHDAITAAGLWYDDAQVTRLEVEKRIADTGEWLECRVGAYWTNDTQLRMRLASSKRGGGR